MSDAPSRPMPSHPSDAETAQALQAFAALWRRKRGDRRLPRRADFPIEELRPWLGYVNLHDVSRAPLRFRIRLAGTRLSLLYPHDPTGRHLDELVPPPLYDAVVAGLVRATGEGVPVLDGFAIRTPSGADYVAHRCVLPLAEDGGEVTALIELLIGRLERVDTFPTDVTGAVVVPIPALPGEADPAGPAGGTDPLPGDKR